MRTLVTVAVKSWVKMLMVQHHKLAEEQTTWKEGKFQSTVRTDKIERKLLIWFIEAAENYNRRV